MRKTDRSTVQSCCFSIATLLVGHRPSYVCTLATNYRKQRVVWHSQPFRARVVQSKGWLRQNKWQADYFHPCFNKSEILILAFSLFAKICVDTFLSREILDAL